MCFAITVYPTGNLLAPPLAIFPYRHIYQTMARTPTTSDVFNAIAEGRRREIIGLLAKRGATTVGTLVVLIGLSQPAVSKHLGVLRKVGLVHVRKQGRERLYELDAAQLKTVHDWICGFEPFWDRHLDRVKQRAEQKARQRNSV